MDFDLLSGFIATPDRDDSADLLSNLPHSELTAHEESMENERVTSPRFNATVSHVADPSQSGAVISKIEDIFEQMTDCILDEKKVMTIELKSRYSKRVKSSENDPRRKPSKPETRTITFPSKSPQEAWKFSMDIYYRDPNLFIRQAVVDRYVDDLAYTLGIDRDALNVVAAAKGLVAGSFTITRNDKSTADYSSESEGVLVPNPKETREVHLNEVKWILVIEKEATFRTLATSFYWRDSAAGKGILITAKGYPDILTRQFLHLLYTNYPEISIHALVDFRPGRLGIASTYTHGSLSLSHQSSTLTVPSLNYLGIRHYDFITPESIEDERGILKLSARDRRIAGKMLEREDLDEEWKRELRVMLMLNVKAEIQILGGGESLGRWLDGKLVAGLKEDIMG
ncbi:hypothetical protein G7Y89_g5596 [Cudoniella acicularis]|uniref:DNA topoisomerase (ATP-hydrolyzing) n=1 Tax=Cudoniella acicularis TaxID=354080 RepID=A0A8H4W6C5_9HELO|nr:hypothetical protein G7Y89_g5596 [Cudoniella acicularis]